MDQNQILELFKKIDEKVDKVGLSQARLEVTNATMKESIAEIKVDVAYHIKRTDLLEADITKLRGFFFYFSVIIGLVGAATTILSNLWRVLH